MDAIKLSSGAADVFAKYGLGCASCRGALQDTVEKAAINNGLDPELLVKELNDSVKGEPEK